MRRISTPMLRNDDLMDPIGWQISLDRYEIEPDPFDPTHEGIRRKPALGISTEITMRKKIDHHDVVLTALVFFRNEDGEEPGSFMTIGDVEVLDVQPRGALVQYGGDVYEIEDVADECVVQHVDASVLPRKALVEFRRDHEMFSKKRTLRHRYDPYR